MKVPALWIKIREANPKMFVVFNNWWAKDDKHLYESGSSIKSDIYEYSYNFYTGKIDIESFYVDKPNFQNQLINSIKQNRYDKWI